MTFIRSLHSYVDSTFSNTTQLKTEADYPVILTLSCNKTPSHTSLVFLINRSMISYRVNRESSLYPVLEMGMKEQERQVVSVFDHVYRSPND